MENSNIGNGGNMSGYTDKKRYAFLYISAVFLMMFIFIFVISVAENELIFNW